MRGPLPSYCPVFPSTFLEQAEKMVRQRTVGTSCGNEPTWCCSCITKPLVSNSEAAERVQLHLRSVQRWRRRWATGDFVLEDEPGRGPKADFSPLDRALVKAVACELVAETKQPLSRQSLADITARARNALGTPISRSTVWRILHADAIKPWRYKYWIFPRDPLFAQRPARFWTSMRARGKASPWAPRITSSVLMRRPASRPASAAIPPCPPCRADQPTSRTNTSAAAPCNIWPRGTCAGGT